MPPIPLNLGGWVFPSKVSVQRYVQAVLRLTEGEIKDPEHFRVIRALLDRHPDVKRKVGKGVAKLFVYRTPEHYNTKCFMVKRVDGTCVDFSYKECLNPSKPKAWFSAACRSAVRPQIDALRAETLAQRDACCPFTNELLSSGNCHIDHAPPWTFSRLVTAFVEAFQVDVQSVRYVDEILSYSVETRFLDATLERKFSAFHDARAQLRAVSVHANMSLLRVTPSGSPPKPRRVVWSTELRRWVDVI